MMLNLSGDIDPHSVSHRADVLRHLRDLSISLYGPDTRDWSALLSVQHCVVLGCSHDCEPGSSVRG